MSAHRSLYILKTILILVHIAIGHSLIGQDQSKVDSLISVLQQERDIQDTVKLSILKKIAFNHPDAFDGLQYAKEARSLSVQMKDIENEAVSLEIIGTQHRLLGNKTKALEAILDALKIYESLNNQKRQAAIYAQLGENEIIAENYNEAIKYLRKAITAYQNLGQYHYQSTLSRLNLGESFRLSGIIDSAKHYFEQVLLSNKELKKRHIQGYAIGNLGMVSNQLNQLEKSKGELHEAIEILSALGDPYSVSVYKSELSDIHLKQEHPLYAEKELNEAFQLAKSAGLKEQVRDISKQLSEYYEGRNQFKKGLNFQKIYQSYQDSLVNRKTIRQIEQLKAGYEIDKRETSINHLAAKNKQQMQLNLGLMIGAGTLFALSFLLFINYKKLQKEKALVDKREKEKILLLKELNHRVKNNLQMVSSLLNLQSRQFKGHPANAALTAGKLRVEALSLIHQKLYQQDHHTQIPIKSYIKELVENLHSAYNSKALLIFDIEELKIDIDIAIPFSLIINELVINSFKYAFHNIDKPQLKIELHQNKNVLSLKLKDNGVGMEIMDLEGATSFGLKLVRSLVKQLEGKIYMTEGLGSTWNISLKSQDSISPKT